MNISKRCIIELNRINNHPADLERGHIYEMTKTPGMPSYATLAQRLKKSITDLLNKIENDVPSITEKAAEGTKNMQPATLLSFTYKCI